MHGRQLRSGVASRVSSPPLEQSTGNTMQRGLANMSLAPSGLAVGGTTPTMQNPRCLQGEPPDALASAVWLIIYSIWVLQGTDSTDLHDPRVTRECTLP